MAKMLDELEAAIDGADKMASAIYLVCDNEAAQDIAPKLKFLANYGKKLAAAVRLADAAVEHRNLKYDENGAMIGDVEAGLLVASKYDKSIVAYEEVQND